MNTIKSLLKKWIFPYSFNSLNNDERFKRIAISLCITLLLPVSIIFGIQNLLSGRAIESLVVFGIGLCLSGLTILLNRSHAYNRTIRFLAITLSGLLFYEFYSGGGNGSALLWFFIFPPAIVFLLGFREGLCWIAGQITALGTLFFGKIGYPYNIDLGIRFIAVYIVLSALSASLEYFRHRYLQQLIEEKKILQQVLDEIRMLKGMVPICSSCKKIRDDKGFWTQIESFMKAHGDVEFSHGICPDCAGKLFPSVNKSRGKEGIGISDTSQETKSPLSDISQN